MDYCIRDEHAVRCDSFEYINPYPIAGNIFLSLPDLYQSENKNKEYWEEIYDKKLSRLSGFVFDGANVTEEIEMVTDIMYRFYDCDNNPEIFDMNINELENELKNAGLAEIQREVEQQLREWIIKKGKDGDE